MTEKLSKEEMMDIIATRWQDPVARIEDTFNIRDAKGRLKPYKVPEPQKRIIREGILGEARYKINDEESPQSHVTVINKGRQMGFSVINAVEAVLIAMDYPNTYIYYVATEIGQARDWMGKMNQLIADANHYPEELGGGPMLNITSIKKIEEKCINDTFIMGLTANPSAIRGKTGVAVYFDEAAWAIRTKNIAAETWKALYYIISQGGQARIQSTPRTSDDQEFFWGMYNKAKNGKGGMVAYECPVIENWRDLDLSEPLYINIDNADRLKRGFEVLPHQEIEYLKAKYKDKTNFIVTDKYIKQDAKVLYPWKSLQELENDRDKDFQQFLQEYLCQPIDETLKLIPSEWIEQNKYSMPDMQDRGFSNNAFQMCIDFAQLRDVTAIVITEKEFDGKIPVYYQRYIEQTQDEYPKQASHIADLYSKFRPEYISIDLTGPGIPLEQYLKKEFRERGFNPSVIKGVTFTSNSKEQMATGFKALCQPHPALKERVDFGEDEEGNPIYDFAFRNRYRFLCNKGNKTHEDMIAHIKRVEKEVLQSSVRYSGKRYGRDDFYHAAAQLVLHEQTNIGVKAAFGSTSSLSQKMSSSKEQKTKGQQFLFNLNQKRFETDKEKEHKEEILKQQLTLLEQRKKSKAISQAYNTLKVSKGLCHTRKKVVHVIECCDTECRNNMCHNYRRVLDVVGNNQVTLDELTDTYEKLFK